MEKDAEERIIQIETKLAYLEDFLNQIQGVAVENSKTIGMLREENRLMAQKIRNVSCQMEAGVTNRKPPHY